MRKMKILLFRTKIFPSTPDSARHREKTMDLEEKKLLSQASERNNSRETRVSREKCEKCTSRCFSQRIRRLLLREYHQTSRNELTRTNMWSVSDFDWMCSIHPRAISLDHFGPLNLHLPPPSTLSARCGRRILEPILRQRRLLCRSALSRHSFSRVL